MHEWLLVTSERLFPSGVLGDAVISNSMKGQESLVSRFAVEFGRHWKQLSGGSASATW